MNLRNLVTWSILLFLPVLAMQEDSDSSISSLVSTKTVESLQSSYKSDTGHFIQNQRHAFLKRKYFKELALLNEIFFPKYWNQCDLATDTLLLTKKLVEFAAVLEKGMEPHVQGNLLMECIIEKMLKQLPVIRERLKCDVRAAFEGDPAATSYTEIIRCYPGFLCLMVQRVAHELYKLETPVYPRELTELAHQLTGIDIHPGADIGDYFFIDHGVGTVIGETCVIGNWCRLYQGVTLGALHFQQDKETHMLKKGYKRHPSLGNNVVVGAGAKILGDISIGDRVNIGANCWVQTDVAPAKTLYIAQHPHQIEKECKTVLNQ